MPELWDYEAVSAHTGVSVSSLRSYQSRAEARRADSVAEETDMPAPQAYVSGRPLWEPATIRAWNGRRLHRGKAADPALLDAVTERKGVRDEAEEALGGAVKAAVAGGHTWAAVARRLGVNQQVAERRYGKPKTPKDG
jgi:hypothetical protein